MSADIIPWERFRQRLINKTMAKGEIPKEVPVIDPGWDEPDAEDIPVIDRARYWGPEYATPGPLTRYFSERQQSDPGDEIDE